MKTAGRTEEFTYDVMHRITSAKNAEGGISSFTFDARGNRTGFTDALGNTHTYSYDLIDSLVGSTDPEGKITEFTYDAEGHPLSVTTPGWRSTYYTYDNNYNVTETVDPKGNIRRYRYNGNNELVKETNPLQESITYVYDKGGRNTSVTDRNGDTVFFTYGKHGNLVTKTDPLGQKTNYTYDLMRNVTSVTTALNVTTTYRYDSVYNKTSMVDALGRETRYSYDLEGNLTGITSPMGRRERITYDAAGRQTSYQTNSGDTIRYDYDQLNDLVEKTYTDNNGTVQCTIGNNVKNDNPSGVIYDYDLEGNRTRMVDTSGNTVYTYDSKGRIKTVTTYRAPKTAGSKVPDMTDGEKVTYEYDTADNLSCIRYPDGTCVRYLYDKNDNLTHVTDRNGCVTRYVYDRLDRVTEMHRPTGVTTYNTWNKQDQITRMRTVCDDCKWVISDYTYTYDARGFVTSEKAIESIYQYPTVSNTYTQYKDMVPQTASHKSLHHSTGTRPDYRMATTFRTFCYDNDGRLISSTENEENEGRTIHSYSYDDNGNRTGYQKCVNGYITEKIAYWYDVDNELRRATHTYGTREYNVNYTYDNDGNLITEKGSTGSYNVNKTYQYTVENRLQAVYEGNDLLLALAYDGDGNKVFQMSYDPYTNATGKTGINTPNVKERSQTETDLRLMIKTSGKINSYSLVEYITDVNTGYLNGIQYPEVLMELNMNGETDTVYVYGNERIQKDKYTGLKNYYIYNGRGSVTSNLSSQGRLTASYRYTPYGELSYGQNHSYANAYTFNGENYHPMTNTQYLRARVYQTKTGRFLTQDTYLGDITNPITTNRYIYCIDNPLNYKDPSGYKTDKELEAIIMDRTSSSNDIIHSEMTLIKRKTAKYNASMQSARIEHTKELARVVNYGCTTEGSVGQNVGWIEYNTGMFTTDSSAGFFALYNGPTVSASYRSYNSKELFDVYDWNPNGVLQGFGGMNTKPNMEGEYKYNGYADNYDTRKGTIRYDGIDRYGIAIGIAFQMPSIDLSIYQGTSGPTADEAIYGTLVDIRIKMKDDYYYIPAFIADAKVHTAPYGVFQTNVSITEKGDLEQKAKEFKEKNPKSETSIVEWYVVKIDNGINKSIGLYQYDQDIDIIIYDKRIQ